MKNHIYIDKIIHLSKLTPHTWFFLMHVITGYCLSLYDLIGDFNCWEFKFANILYVLMKNRHPQADLKKLNPHTLLLTWHHVSHSLQGYAVTRSSSTNTGHAIWGPSEFSLPGLTCPFPKHAGPPPNNPRPTSFPSN